MTARGCEIAEAIVTAFNSGYGAVPRRISQDIVASQVFTTVLKNQLAELPVWDHAAPVQGAIKVYVIELPETPGDDGDSRDRFWVDYHFQIGVAAQPKTLDVNDIAPLKLVSQELRDYCLQTDPAYSLDIQEGVTELPKVLADPDFETLRANKLFMSVFEITFRGARRL